jgi:Methyltransferase domain
MKAWWEGYDGQEYEAWLAARANEEAAKRRSRSGDGGRRSIFRRPAWEPTRIDIANLIWGEGYCGPGGPQHVIDLVKPMGLTREMSVLIMGGGLGGPARVLAKEHGCYVDAYEDSKELVAAGSELSHVAGLSKKAALEHYNFHRCPPLKRKYDAAVSMEALYTVENKPGALKAVSSAMKPCKLFVLTDYVVADTVGLDDPDIQNWIESEPGEIFPIQNQDLVPLIEQSDFNLRAKEDLSDQYRGVIAKSWVNAGNLAQGLIDKGDEGRPLVDTLLREAALWARRSTLLSQQKLRVMRYLAERVWFD